MYSAKAIVDFPVFGNVALMAKGKTRENIV